MRKKSRSMSLFHGWLLPGGASADYLGKCSWDLEREKQLSKVMVTPFLIGLVVFCGRGFTAEKQVNPDDVRYIRAHYDKFEYRIPMRDGVRLFTAVYIPNDRSRNYPILMKRTPYGSGPYGADRYPDSLGPSMDYVRSGFIFVNQDVRGKYLSEGEFVNMRPHLEGKGKHQFDESSDTYDTIEWLLKNVPGHNGRVGQWGISYPGFYAAAGMIDSHPALKAVSPQAPIADWFWDDMHRHGAFVLPLAFNFFASFGQARPVPTPFRAERFDHGTPDGYRFFLDLGPLSNANRRHFDGRIEFWNRFVEHPNYDSFWQSRNLLPHLKNIKAAVMIVGGWFDTEDLYGPLNIYRSTEERNPGIYNCLVMGPWAHGGWVRDQGDSLGDMNFGYPTSAYYQAAIGLKFFNHFLKDEASPNLPEAHVFETGANRWRSFDHWPPEGLSSQALYMAAGGGLTLQPPTQGDEAHDAYRSDPAKPVPYTKEITNGWARDYMTEDQRFAAWRPDVLVYQTPPLQEDLTIAGPILADLWVSTSGTDSDWIVKVIDVYPPDVDVLTEEEEMIAEAVMVEGEEKKMMGDAQILVRYEAFRGRFRESYEHPKPFVADEITRVKVPLLDILHTFKRGHRMMVHIQSSFFPFIDRNPQKYVPNIFLAEESDFIAVTNRIYRSRTHPSTLSFKVLDPPR